MSEGEVSLIVEKCCDVDNWQYYTPIVRDVFVSVAAILTVGIAWLAGKHYIKIDINGVPNKEQSRKSLDQKNEEQGSDKNVDSQEDDKKISRLEKLIAKGDAESQNSIGTMYSTGDGVDAIDYKEAREWYDKAAMQNYANAQYNIGVMYDNGHGVDVDHKEAHEWYEKAAKQGYANAQYNLAIMYFSGKGTLQSFINAHMWANLSSANGDKEAQQFRDRIATKMNNEQIIEAQKLAEKWKSENPDSVDSE